MDGTVALWDTSRVGRESGRPLELFRDDRAHDGGIFSMHWSRGAGVLTSSKDGTTCVSRLADDASSASSTGGAPGLSPRAAAASNAQATAAGLAELSQLTGKEEVKAFLKARGVDVPSGADTAELSRLAQANAHLPVLKWRPQKTADGRVYYYNAKTKETSWTMPEDM